MIRVVLADDHGIVRDGLGRLISALDDVELVGVAADGAEAVEQCRRTTPDVVLIDLDMPVLDGIEATERILAERPETAVLVLTAFSDRGRITGALKAGARGYLLKDVDARGVAEGIRAAARGEAPLDPRAARTMLDAQSQPDPLAGLSEREREVLGLLVEGLPNKLIARRLGAVGDAELAEDPREVGLHGLLADLQAALWAERHGLTD